MKRFFLAFLIATLITANPLWGRIIRIPDDYSNIQAGINASVTGDTVLVMPGTYVESVAISDKDITLASRFILTGDTMDVVQTIIEWGGDIITLYQVNSTVVGLTLTHGTAGIKAFLSVLQTDTLRLNNMTMIYLDGPAVGSGIDGSLCLYASRCQVYNGGSGFELGHYGATHIEVDSSQFDGIWAPIKFIDNHFTGTVSHCSFTNIFGTAVECPSGGVSEIAIDDCQFGGYGTWAAYGSFNMANCSIRGWGSGAGGSSDMDFPDHYSVANCTFDSIEYAVFQAAGHCTISNSVITNCRRQVISDSLFGDTVVFDFQGCRMLNNGGGIFLSGPGMQFSMDHCLFAGNGEGISLRADSSSEIGFVNNTVANNRDDGLNIAVDSSGPPATCAMTNNIIGFNARSGIEVNLAEPGDSLGILVSYNDVWQNAGGNYTGLSDRNGRDGNISSDPDFVDTLSIDYHLQADSPCIDAGDPASPQDPDYTRADMGAFYFPQGPGCDYVAGDVNGNGVANGLDVVYFVNYLRQIGPPPDSCDCGPWGVIFPAADANGNCDANGIDVTYMVNYYKGGPELRFCADCPPGRQISRILRDK